MILRAYAVDPADGTLHEKATLGLAGVVHPAPFGELAFQGPIRDGFVLAWALAHAPYCTSGHFAGWFRIAEVAREPTLRRASARFVPVEFSVPPLQPAAPPRRRMARLAR